MPSPKRRVVELIRSEPLSSVVRNLTFRALDAEPFRWEPGQYVELYSGDSVAQPYSIASAPDPARPGVLELAVTELGQRLQEAGLERLVPGARFEMAGPFGGLTRAGLEHRPALLVGTGTGIAPLRALLQEELRRSAGPPIALLHGARTEEDLLFEPELRAMAAGHPRFRYEPTLSRAAPGWRGRTGYVQAHLAPLLAELGDAVVFVCGAPAIVEEVTGLLAGPLRKAPEDVRVERH